MTDTGETSGEETSGAGSKRNKGQGLVAAFRAARLSQRPALKTGLRTGRAALRQERLERLGKGAPPAASTCAAQTETAPDDVAARPEPAPAPILGASIFATFLDRAEDEATPKDAPSQAAPPATSLEEATADTVAAEAAAPEAVEPEPPAPEPPAPPRVPLSSIGFGPGMMIRMSHLGIETVQELAAADPVWLRGALGDISRLINVELWIASARNACTEAA